MGACFTDERFKKLNSKCNFVNIKLNDEVKIALDQSNQSIKQKTNWSNVIYLYVRYQVRQKLMYQIIWYVESK